MGNGKLASDFKWLGLAWVAVMASGNQVGGQETVRPRGAATQVAPTVSMSDRLSATLRDQIDPFKPRRLQSLLLKPEVQAELNVDRRMYSMISEALTDLNQQQNEFFQAQRESMASGDREKIREHMEQYRQLRDQMEQATQEALSEVFPPDSFERLKQIALQIQIREAGLANMLMHGVLADKLELSPDQLDTLQERSAEYDQELQAKIKQLEAEYEAKLLGHLTPQQRQAYRQEVGEPFEYQPLSMEAQQFEQVKRMQARQMPAAPPASSP